MGVSTEHPQYSKFKADWDDMTNALNGERGVKSKGVLYLPETAGITEIRKQDQGFANAIYNAYKLRAQYPEWVRDATRSMTGLVARLPVSFEPKHKSLEILRTQATDDGFDINELFIRCCNTGVQYGRYALLADFDEKGQPYIAKYDALSILNWKAGAVGGRRDDRLIVLREEHLKGDDEFSHETVTRYRVLDLDEHGFYRVRLFEDDVVISEKYPMMGANKLKFIPIVFGGSLNNSRDVNPIPLQTMARSAIKYYQLSADYFQSLYMTAHPQAWVSGFEEAPPSYDEDGNEIKKDSELRVTGATTVWMLPATAKVGFLEIDGKGISLTKDEMDSQKNSAIESGAKVIDSGSSESGEARKARQDDQQASLHTIIQSAANAIEQVVKYLALWQNLDDSEIVYNVNLEFSKDIEPTILTKLYDLLVSGKISGETLWTYLQTGKIAERSYEDEQKLIDLESSNKPFNA